MTYPDLLAIVRYAPRGSAIARATLGEDVEWSLTNQLLAAQVDLLAVLRWYKTEDGSRGRNRPKPIPRPGIADETETRQIGRDPVPLDELDEFLGWTTPSLN